MTTILVVDHDEKLAYSLARQIRMAGYEVIPVNSTMAALDLLDTKTIDLLLVDLAMRSGQPSGLALGRMARMKRQGIGVILMTGHNDLRLDSEILPGKLFYKPVDMQNLTAEIAAQLADRLRADHGARHAAP
jgi:DNA-binding NtrC family response regulator